MTPKELRTVREINTKLPFAHPIEQGDEATLREVFGLPEMWYSEHPALTDIPELNPLNG